MRTYHLRAARALTIACALVAAQALAVDNDHSLPLQWQPPQALPAGTASWQALAAAPAAVSRPAAAWHAGRLYVIGGEETGGLRPGTVQRYSVDTGAWDTSLPAMPSPASNTCAAVLGGDIYVPGGWDGAASQAVLRVLDLDTGTWSTVASDPLPAANAAHGCTAVDGRLYVIGGSTTGATGTTAFAYDPAAPAGARWTTLPATPFATSYLGVAGDGRFVYAVGGGGATNLADAARYDTVAGSWSPLPALLTPRSGLGLARLYGSLYAVGGGWSSYLATEEALDLANPVAWQPRPNVLLQGRRTFGLAASHRDGALFAAAGWNGAFLNSAERRPRDVGRWLRLLSAPLAVSRPVGVLVGRHYYLIGGEETGGLRNGPTQRYDMDSGLWDNALPAMPDPASNLCAAAIGTTIYVPGGYSGSAGFATLRAFDTQAGTWSVVASDPLPAAVYAHGCAVLDGRLYVAGGSGTGAPGNGVWRYDPAAAAGARWSAMPSLQNPASYPGIVTDGDYLYVSTGNPTDATTVERFDPVLNAWTPLPPLNTGRGGAALLVSANTLIAVGGGWSTYQAGYEVLDRNHPSTGWSTVVGGLNVGRRTFGASGDGSTLIVAGGWAGAYLADAELYFDDTIYANDFD